MLVRNVAGEHAAEALQQALALDPRLPMAHALLGVLQNQWQWDWPAAQRSFRRALALAPEAAFVHAAWGSHLFMRGRLDEAEAEIQVSLERDCAAVATAPIGPPHGSLPLLCCRQRFRKGCTVAQAEFKGMTQAFCIADGEFVDRQIFAWTDNMPVGRVWRRASISGGE